MAGDAGRPILLVDAYPPVKNWESTEGSGAIDNGDPEKDVVLALLPHKSYWFPEEVVVDGIMVHPFYDQIHDHIVNRGDADLYRVAQFAAVVVCAIVVSFYRARRPCLL